MEGQYRNYLLRIREKIYRIIYMYYVYSSDKIKTFWNEIYLFIFFFFKFEIKGKSWNAFAMDMKI